MIEIPDGIPVLSVRQPWAWLIVNGYKDVENRSWPTNYRGPVLVHAGTRLDEEYARNTVGMRNALEYLMERQKQDGYTLLMRPKDKPWTPLPEKFDMGGIVGLTVIRNCTKVCVSYWFGGPWGFELNNWDAVPLSLIPCRGQLGFFKPPTGILEAVRAQLKAG